MTSRTTSAVGEVTSASHMTDARGGQPARWPRRQKALGIDGYDVPIGAGQNWYVVLVADDRRSAARVTELGSGRPIAVLVAGCGLLVGADRGWRNLVLDRPQDRLRVLLARTRLDTRITVRDDLRDAITAAG